MKKIVRIDIHNMCKNGESTRMLLDIENLTYNCEGNVHCRCPKTGTERKMACGGFEKDWNTLKELCPIRQFDKQVFCIK